MKKYVWTIINAIQLVVIIVLDLKYASASKDTLTVSVHVLVSLILYPLLLATILSLVISIFPLDKIPYWHLFKKYYKFALFAILFFFWTGHLSLLLME